MALAALQKVILTREAEDNAELAALLTGERFEVLEYPCIETRYIYSEQPVLANYDMLSFSSRRAARGAILNAGAAALRACRLAAVGESSAAELRLHGLGVEIVADPPNADNLADIMCRKLQKGARILNVRGSMGLDILKNKCFGCGLMVDEWIVYQNDAPELNALGENADYAVFASPSAAERFFAVNATLGAKLRCVAIGPTTKAALQKLNVSHIRMARGVEAHDILECLKDWRNADDR